MVFNFLNNLIFPIFDVLELQVDLIAIDFGERLPFRLKQSMVKAAIQVVSWTLIT